MSEPAGEPKVSIGYCSETGLRRRNEDFVGAVVGGWGGDERRDVAAAVADGIGGARGGREAAETAVRGFLDGLWDVPQTINVQSAAAKILGALNGWIHAQGRQDEALKGMGCTFTALILRGRTAHVVHVGDSRAYRLSGRNLTRLTHDHVREGPGGSQLLYRALGVEADLRLDYAAHPMALHDRFLLCSDGVHAHLADEQIREILSARFAPADASRALVEAALAAASTDNCTALVLDVTGLPTAPLEDIGREFMRLPVLPPPRVGEVVDDFELTALISEGPFSRLLAAEDRLEGGRVALKFPRITETSPEAQLDSFVREAWVGARIRNPAVVHAVELAPGRQTRLYTVMPLYRGELLETRLQRRPAIGLEEARNIGVQLARGAAALHRAGVIHRDIKPDNVMLEDGGAVKLLDLGVVRLPGLEDAPPTRTPGTAAYMAPEMFEGDAGDAATDVYALGVTLFRALTGEFPYGNVDATSRPRLDRAKDLNLLRTDLPAWLGETIGRAIARRAERYADMLDLAEDLEAGPSGAPSGPPEPPTFYQRHKLRFWQALSALLALALAILLWRR